MAKRFTVPLAKYNELKDELEVTAREYGLAKTRCDAALVRVGTLTVSLDSLMKARQADKERLAAVSTLGRALRAAGNAPLADMIDILLR